MNANETQEITLPVLTLLQRIKDSVVDPQTLDRQTRQACVEAMIGEGVSQAQIAVHLKCSDKTIQRDVQEIRQKNALTASPDLAREIIGDMNCKLRMSTNRLMQLSRGANGSLMEKTLAEYYAAQVVKIHMNLLQSLGYLPQKAQEFIGDVFHHKAEEDVETSWLQIEEAINDIDLTTKGKNDAKSAEVKKDIKRLRVNLERTKLLAECQKVTKKTKEINKNDNTRQSKKDN